MPLSLPIAARYLESSLRYLGIAIGLAASAGCGAAGTTTMPGASVDAGPPAMQFVDESTLAPIAEGSKAQIIHGPQGGYHIVVNLLATNIWPGTSGVPGATDDPTTTFHALRASGMEFTLMTDNTYIAHVAWENAGAGYLLRERQLRLDTAMPATLDGETLELRANLVDRDGRTASSSVHVVAQRPLN